MLKLNENWPNIYEKKSLKIAKNHWNWLKISEKLEKNDVEKLVKFDQKTLKIIENLVKIW